LKLPTGVRAAATMTMSLSDMKLSRSEGLHRARDLRNLAP
jgi:hypothetical protein